MYCQHLLHQLSVLWSELASEDGIPLGVMDSKGWEGRGAEEGREGRGWNERKGRGKEWRGGAYTQ